MARFESELVIAAQTMDQEIHCTAPFCKVPLSGTSLEGIEVAFWLGKPGGNRGEVLTARVRVIPVDDTSETAGPWYVQVLSSQWAGDSVDACAVAWDTFPSLGVPPDWLSTPESEDGLASLTLYNHLAAELIRAGAADVSGCLDGGLAPEGLPSPCGLDAASPIVYTWQNQFDMTVLEAATRIPVPAAILKAMIAQESQFWPGSVVNRGEYGLGHLTENGADNTLLWNKDLYGDFCPSKLSEPLCARGYAQLSDYQKGLLSGSLIAQVNADCPDCEFGVDLQTAGQGIYILVDALQAYCAQTGRMVYNVAGTTPGRVTTYEDMWKLTLAGYAAGPGCLADALGQAYEKGEGLTWATVSGELSDHCTGAIQYVQAISG